MSALALFRKPDNFHMAEYGPDQFTREDRIELTRQGVILDLLKTEIATKASKGELSTPQIIDHEVRLRKIETDAGEFRGALKVILWMGPVVCSVIAAGISYALSKLFH